MHKRIFLGLLLMIFLPVFAQISAKEQTQNEIKADAIPPAKAQTKEAVKFVLEVNPLENDFGAIAHFEGSRGVYTIKNTGAGTVNWKIGASEGWSLLDKEKLSGVITEKPVSLKVQISSLKKVNAEVNGNIKNLSLVQITLEANNKFAIYQKKLPLGTHREALKIESGAGSKNIFLRFNLISDTSEPKIHVDPLRIDYGVLAPDQTVTKRVKVTNIGKSTLRWKTYVQQDQDALSALKRGRYVSFMNEEITGSGVYAPPQHLRDALEISGTWSEFEGYPYGDNPNQVLKYRFEGTGISLFFVTHSEGGAVMAYVNDRRENTYECDAEIREQTECLIAEGLPYGTHTLTLAVKGKQVFIEGVRLHGVEILKGSTGWINIFPDSGTTTKETDYVAIILNTKQLKPGYYGENIVFDSNGGQPVLELSFEVTDKDAQKVLDVYRYVSFFDFFYTSNPQQDLEKITSMGYRKQGIAFRLFSSGVPGTRPFLRWYHPVKRVHFLTHETAGDALTKKGYRLEGSIGNIATSRLTNSKALYRWFNQEKGSYFYTTDTRGEEIAKQGYRFDRIAGYVRQ